MKDRDNKGRFKRIEAVEGFYWCGGCKKYVLDSEVTKYVLSQKKKEQGGRCRECAKEYRKKFVYDTDKYREGNKASVLKYNLKKFGLTPEDYKNMLTNQNNRCMICNMREEGFKKRLAVDHNHETGKVRGLLCNKCNTGLGLFKDNSDLLEKASEYLKLYVS